MNKIIKTIINQNFVIDEDCLKLYNTGIINKFNNKDAVECYKKKNKKKE